jgi:hypothetical protein
MKEIPNDCVHIKTLIRELKRRRLVMVAQLQLASKIITSQSGRFAIRSRYRNDLFLQNENHLANTLQSQTPLGLSED